MAEQVTIKINVNADTAVIERLRAQLKSLCREADDCSDTFDKYSKGLDSTSTNQKKLTETTEGHSKAVKRLSGSQKANNKDNDSFIKKLFSMDGAGKKLLGGLAKLAMFGFKYVAIEAAAAALVIASSAILFKSGAFLAKAYQIGLAGVGLALTALVAAGSAFLAVQQQFASVQFAPMFQAGLVNTSDKFLSADLAMRSFVGSASLSVFGTKALTASFAELAKNIDPSKLGEATGAMRQMGNVAAGMGGDIGANFGEVSKFVAGFAKEGKLTDAVKKQGEGLSPIFKKVIGESVKAGNTTYTEFMSGLATNKTFQDAYAGQLDAVNNTVMGKFKGAITEIKSLLTDMGGGMLNPLGAAVTKIKNLILALLMRVRGGVEELGSGGLLDGLVKGVEKLTLLMGKLMTTDLAAGAGSIQTMKNAWQDIAGFFEKIQDYLRPLQEAASALWAAVQPLFAAFAGNFDSTIQSLSKSLVDNKENIVAFTTEVGKFLTSFSNFGLVLKEAFIKALPVLKMLAGVLTTIFDMLTKVFGTINKLGGPIGGLATLMAGFLGMRALKIGAKGVGNKVNSGIAGKMGMGGMGGAVGQNVATMNVTAGVVNMSGGMGPLGPTQGPPSPGSGKGIKGAYAAARAGGSGRMASMKAAGGNMMAGGKNMMAGYGPMALMGAGMGINALNDKYLDGNNYVGAAGSMAQTAGMIAMMGGSAGMAGVGAIGVGAYKVGGALSEKFVGNDDSLKGKGTGALVGAAGGAAVGAAVGSVVPVIGTAAGAVIGAIVGGVSGWMSAGKNKKKARKAADEFTSGFSSQVEQAFKDGDVAALNELKDSYVEQATAAAAGNQDVYNEKIKEFEPELQKINNRIDTFTANASTMERYLGLTTDGMNLLAEKFGFDFQGGIISVFEVIGRAGEELGIDIAGFFKNVLGEIQQKQTSMILDLMDKPGDLREAGKKLDASAAAVMSGDVSPEALEELVKDQFALNMSQTGGDMAKSLALMDEVFATQTQDGGILAGKGELLGATQESMGLRDNNNLVNIARDSGSVDLLAQSISDASLGTMSKESATETLLSQIATGGYDAMIKQQEILKSYGLQKSITKNGEQTSYGSSPIGITDLELLSFAGAGQMDALTQAAFDRNNGEANYGGGINLTPTVSPSATLGAPAALVPSSQVITVGETRITVSGIMSSSEAQIIANAVAAVQSSTAERIGRRPTDAYIKAEP